MTSGWTKADIRQNIAERRRNLGRAQLSAMVPCGPFAATAARRALRQLARTIDPRVSSQQSTHQTRKDGPRHPDANITAATMKFFNPPLRVHPNMAPALEAATPSTTPHRQPSPVSTVSASRRKGVFTAGHSFRGGRRRPRLEGGPAPTVSRLPAGRHRTQSRRNAPHHATARHGALGPTTPQLAVLLSRCLHPATVGTAAR